MSESNREFVPTGTHWGNYLVEVRDGVFHDVHGLDDDPSPSPIGTGMPWAHDSLSRLYAPMVRAGWLEHGLGAIPRDVGRRGGEPFVEVTHEEAVGLVADQLECVRHRHFTARPGAEL